MSRILLVDDEALIRQLACRMLEGAGYEVLQAEDGLTAFHLVRQTNGALDLLITDIVMPRMSGTELANRVYAEYPGLQILLISGFADTRVPDGYPFLSKPFTCSALVGTIQKLVGMHGGEAPADDRRRRESDLQMRLAGARARLECANEEYKRLTAVCADAVENHCDGRLALRQAMALKQDAHSEFMKALREWNDFVADAKRT